MQVAHYFSKSAAEETSRRDELIARGSCCGENCRDCPYNPKHTSGVTALKDPTEKHVKAQEPTPPPSWEPSKSAVAAHLKAAYAMSPEARAYYESNRKPREQLAQEHFAQAQQATARQNEERANAELQRFDNLSYPQKFWEKSKEMYGDTANMISEGAGGIAPYFSKALRGAGGAGWLNKTKGFAKSFIVDAGGAVLNAVPETVSNIATPFAKARALQNAARNTKPGDPDYDRLKYYRGQGLLSAAKEYAAKEYKLPGLNQNDPNMPEMYLHSDSNWTEGQAGAAAGLRRLIPQNNPAASFARGAASFISDPVSKVQNNAFHAWDAVQPGKWRTTQDTKQVANPYYGAVDSTGQAVPQYLTLQAQTQRPLGGDWNSQGNGAAVAQDLQNREQFEQDPRNYWDKVTDTHVAANAPDGSPVRAFKYPANVEFHTDFTAPKGPRGYPKAPLVTPNNIIGKPGQRTAVTGNPAYDPNKFDNQPKWLNLGQPAPPKAPTPPTSPIARK